MHPFVRSIPPALRSALTAGILARLFLWTQAILQRGSAAAVLDNLQLDGTLAALILNSVGAVAAAISPTIAGLPTDRLLLCALSEILWLAAATSVFTFARQRELPQTAERATWLFVFCPLIAWLEPTPSSWSLAICAVACAFGIASRGYHLYALAALAFAITARLEALIAWPAVASVGWYARSAKPVEPWQPLALALGPLLCFSATIGVAFNCAGLGGISIRSIQAQTQWRTTMPPLESPELLVGLIALGAFGLYARYAKHVPKRYLTALVPALLYPFSQSPTAQAAPSILLALPLFVLLGKASDEPSIERPLLALFVGACLLV